MMSWCTAAISRRRASTASAASAGADHTASRAAFPKTHSQPDWLRRLTSGVTLYPADERWLYTAAVHDIFYPKVIGWAMSGPSLAGRNTIRQGNCE